MDIYHALEHVSDCGKSLYGRGQTFSDWLERMRLVLLSEGFVGMERELLSLNELDDDKRKSVSSLLEYLRKHECRLHYCERLLAGRSIGSGLVEGACWRLEQANRMAILCATFYSDQWKKAWKKSH